jgi:hypothetical protein
MPWEGVNNLPACFETQLELKGLDRISTKSLLQRTAKDCGVNFSQPAIATFWRFFKGHPRLTLQAGSLAHQRVSEKGQNQVDQKVAKVSCQVVNQRHQDYLKMLYPPTDPKSFRPDAN